MQLLEIGLFDKYSIVLLFPLPVPFPHALFPFLFPSPPSLSAFTPSSHFYFSRLPTLSMWRFASVRTHTSPPSLRSNLMSVSRAQDCKWLSQVKAKQWYSCHVSILVLGLSGLSPRHGCPYWMTHVAQRMTAFTVAIL